MKTKIFSAVLATMLCFSMVACSVDEVLTDVDLAIQMTANLAPAIGNVSPDEAAAITRLSGVASVGLTAVRDAYEAYEKSGAQSDLDKVQAIAGALRSNLAEELQAAHITNPETVAKVNAWVGLVTVSLDAIIALSKQVKTSQVSESFQRCAPDGNFNACMSFASSIAGVYVPKAATLKKDWDKRVCKGNKACEVKVRKAKRKK